MKTLFVLGLFLSVPAMAAENDGKLHEAKLIAAQKWDDVTENLKVWLPGSVVKEFKTSVDSKPFPSVRKLKYGLQVTQNNGMRVTIQFKSNGRVSFNGKDWRFKPLESIDNQVEQLALFLSGDQKRAGMELISSAYSASAAEKDRAGAFGLAALAFASANAWKADACDEDGLTDELVEDCTLMAVAMRMDIDGWKKQARGYGLFGEIRRATVETGKDVAGFYPIGLKCPKENGGKLQFVVKDQAGTTIKYLADFKRDDLVHLKSYVADLGKSFEPYLDFPRTDEKKSQRYKKLLGSLESLNNEVCNGNASEKKKFLAALESNAEMLKQYSNKNSDPEEDDKKSIEST
jgi:hypothetical protein